MDVVKQHETGQEQVFYSKWVLGLLAWIRAPPCFDTLHGRGNLILLSCIWVTSGLLLMPSRSSGAKLFQLASAEGHWSPRCTTARSNSLCHAGCQSREVPSSRPTGPTPTLSRRAAPAQSHAVS